MGKRGKGKARGSSGAAGRTSPDPIDAILEMFKPLPPNKRSELNKIVEKLLHLSSNFQQEPLTPGKLWEEFEEIHEIVEKVRVLEQCNMSRKLTGTRKGQLKTFLEWLDRHGAKIDGVEIAEYGNQGFGLRCTKDLSQGDTVIKIPRKVMMSVDTAKDSSIGPLIEKDPMLQTMSNVTLALHLVIEKNSPASFWEPYINVLPHDYTTVLYFTPEEFKELKGSPAFEDALKQYKYVARQYAYFYKKFQGTMLRDYFTYDEYRWAVSSVMTRQNYLPSTAEPPEKKAEDEIDPRTTPKMVNTLIPYWDFANHEDGEISTDYDPDADMSICLANKDFKVGDQFTIFYGVRSNIDLLVHNGFVVPENKDDRLILKLGVSKKDQLFNEKTDLLEKLMIPMTCTFHLSNDKDKPVDGLLMAFVRVNCLNVKEDIDAWTNNDNSRELLEKVLPEEHKELDKKAFQWLLTRCSLLLRSYATTLEQDIELLQKLDTSSKLKLCIELRLMEKRILKTAVEYCQKRVS